MADTFEKLARAILQRSPDVAHDIKTPLNIVVLHVELLKMQLRRLGAEVESDEKVQEHCRSIDRETRRISAIADAYLSVAQLPADDAPARRDATAAFGEELREAGFSVKHSELCELMVYSSRLDKAAKQFAIGLAGVIEPSKSIADCTVEEGLLTLEIEGPLRDETAEIGKLFKFYYTDPSGEPNLQMASARLLIESMGGLVEMQVSEEIVRFRIELQGDE